MAGEGVGLRYLMTPKAGADGTPRKRCGFCPSRTMIVFTVNLLLGLVIGQTVGSSASSGFRHAWDEAVGAFTMFCLSYIMINVGYEFDIDKAHIRKYVKEYLIAMTAAGFPWVFVALYFMFMPGISLVWKEALLAARFAAPTSAGILFSMLEASGMRETWLFEKARLLAIFDDLDTILLMIPLKAVMTGMKWELSVDAILCFGFIAVAWVKLHAVRMPTHWRATLLYARAVMVVCELVHLVSADHVDAMDAVHLEVLLPAFTIGCVAAHADKEEHAGAATRPRRPRSARPPTAEPGRRGSSAGASAATHGGAPSERARRGRGGRAGAAARAAAAAAGATPSLCDRVRALESEKVSTVISAVFMLFVGLSMPPMGGGDDRDDDGGGGGHRRRPRGRRRRARATTAATRRSRPARSSRTSSR